MDAHHVIGLQRVGLYITALIACDWGAFRNKPLLGQLIRVTKDGLVPLPLNK